MRFWNNSTCTQALDMFMSYFCKINRVYVISVGVNLTLDKWDMMMYTK